MRRLLVIASALVVGACSGGSSTAVTVTLLDPAGASALIQDQPDLVVLDIRTPEETAAGTLPGATEIDFYAADFSDRIAALDRDGPYLVYCHSGNRSAQAITLMVDLGFTNLYELDGGILAWLQSGSNVEG